MMEFLDYVQELGSLSIDVFWLPVVLWTVMGLLGLGIMKYSEEAHSFFQYHGRIALLCALPAGILFSIINHWINSFTQLSAQFATKFIVIQSPVTIYAGDQIQLWALLDHELLAGLLAVLMGVISGFLLIKTVLHFITLNKFSARLEKIKLQEIDGISPGNVQLAHEYSAEIIVAFSQQTDLPFTFGTNRPVIVIPNKMSHGNTDKLNMTIRHELMHIKHRDYAINSFIMIVKALFWFHPLIYKLYNGLKEYREISCDSEVLSDTTISPRSYAQLLFELAPKHIVKNEPAVSMAVNSSTLKKRIQIMSSQKNKPDMFKTSIYTMLVSALFMTGIMACSDIQDSGITNKDIENVQSEMTEDNHKQNPLYIMNGAVMDENILSRIKPEYIKSIDVLKGEKATEKYGEKGKNGVIEFKLIDEEKALDDLLPTAPEKPKEKFNATEDYFVVVEQMPELMGGMRDLQGCVEYPEMAKKAGIEGRVIVQFIVTEQGEVENPQVIRGIGGGADKEALRCVRQAEFKPGRQRGKPVRVQYSLPIIFKLQDSSTIQKEQSSVYMESPKVDGKQMEIRNLTRLPNSNLEGFVFDVENDQPLTGANVFLESTQKGVSTNKNGKFTISNAKESNPKIRISYIGYRSMIAEVKQ